MRSAGPRSESLSQSTLGDSLASRAGQTRLESPWLSREFVAMSAWSVLGKPVDAEPCAREDLTGLGGEAPEVHHAYAAKA